MSDPGPATKLCTKCGQVRPVTHFHLIHTGRPARQAYCRDCINTIRRDLYRKAKK